MDSPKFGYKAGINNLFQVFNIVEKDINPLKSTSYLRSKVEEDKKLTFLVDNYPCEFNPPMS